MIYLYLSFTLIIALSLSPVELKAQNKTKLPTSQKKTTTPVAPSSTAPTAQNSTSSSSSVPGGPTTSGGEPGRTSGGEPGRTSGGEPGRTSGGSIAAGSGGGEAKALEVRGQARSVQMMMLLKGKGDDIHFVKPRKDFRPEVNTTTY